MNVSSVSGPIAAQRTTATEASSTASYDNFLKLLMAQMKNQDPTEPMKSTDYMAQLATFSQVEQTVKSNSKLDALLASSALSQADSVIGRTISTADGKVSGQVTSVTIISEGAVAKLTNGDQVLLGPGVIVS